MNKILIIGRYGQLAEALSTLKVEDEIMTFDRNEIDIRKITNVEEKIKKFSPSFMINTSTFHNVPLCEIEPQNAFEINAIAVFNLARLCKKYKIKLITYSTDYVFDGRKTSPYGESDIPNPLQTYGISKLAGEYAALNYFPEGAYVIRTSGVYGGKKGSKDKGGNFVLSILNQAKKNEQVNITAEMKVTTTFADDLAFASYELIKKNAKPGIYHLINEGSCTWKEFGREILNNANLHKEIISNKARNPDNIIRPAYSVLKNNKAKKLGVLLPPWQDALKRYIKFLQYE